MNDFRVLESERWPSGSYFAELFPLPGPAAVADIGNGTLRERYGWNWLVLITRERVPQVWQEVPAGSGEWHQVTDLLPPVFGTVLPDGARRLTGVFDQSGRLVIAYEHEELVRVTRWDVETQSYVQNVTFPGVNPALTTDLHAGIAPGDSDVQIFYQPPDDLTRVQCRIQRDLYLTVYTVWGDVDPEDPDPPVFEPVILDRAQVNSLQLELLVSDLAGNPLRGPDGRLNVLASPYYPRFVQDAVLLDAVPTVGIYEETTLVRSVEDAVLLDATVLNPLGLSGEPVTVSSNPSLVPPPPYVLAGSVNGGYATRTGLGGSDGCGTQDGGMPALPGIGGTTVAPQSHAFDAVVMATDLLGETYGIRGLSGYFRVQWYTTHREAGKNAASDGINMYHLVYNESTETWSCQVLETWRAQPRTVVVEVGYNAGGPPGVGTAWIEVYRHTETPSETWPDGVSSGALTEHSFNADVSVLASLDSQRFFIRVRALQDDPITYNSTGARLLGGYTFQLDMLTNAYVSNVLQRSVQDAVMLDAVPTIGRYQDDLTVYKLQDHVMLDATPSVGRYDLYIGANPQVQDHVMLDAIPTIGRYQEV